MFAAIKPTPPPEAEQKSITPGVSFFGIAEKKPSVKPKKRRLIVKFLMQIADELGLLAETFSEDWIVALTNPRTAETRFVFGYSFDLNPQSVSKICDDKVSLSHVLERRGIPRVEHQIFLNPNLKEYTPTSGSMAPLFEFSDRHANSIVIKPKDGSGGKGVMLCRNRRDIEKAAMEIWGKDYALAASPYEEIIMEYRVIYLSGEVKLIFSKQRPCIKGDGHSTIRNLLIKELEKHPEKLDLFKKSENFSELDFNDVPAEGKVIPIIWKHNLVAGAEATEVKPGSGTFEILEKLTLAATKALNLQFVSVDIVKVFNKTPEAAVGSYVEQTDSGEVYEYKIIEINSGVMMEKIALFIDNGMEVIKDIYRHAVMKMFAMESSLDKTLTGDDGESEEKLRLPDSLKMS